MGNKTLISKKIAETTPTTDNDFMGTLLPTIQKELIARALLMMCLLGLFLANGCTQPTRSKQFSHPDCDRVAISNTEISQGLKELFTRMEATFGPIDSSAIISDFGDVIRESLYHNGWCRLHQLGINGLRCDIQIYFTLAAQPGELRLEAYRAAGGEPLYRVIKPYHVEMTPVENAAESF